MELEILWLYFQIKIELFKKKSVNLSHNAQSQCRTVKSKVLSIAKAYKKPYKLNKTNKTDKFKNSDIKAYPRSKPNSAPLSKPTNTKKVHLNNQN